MQGALATAKVSKIPIADFSPHAVQIITDATFKAHQGFDLASFDDKNVPPSELPVFRVLKNESYKTFKARVAQHFQYPESNFRLWVLVNRQNKTVRPDSPVEDMDGALTMEHVRNTMANRTTELRLYLDYEPKAEFLQTVRTYPTFAACVRRG